MNHLDNGELRRLLDEPQSFSDEARSHAQSCSECRERAERVRADAAFAAHALGGAFVADAAGAYARVAQNAMPRTEDSRWYVSLSVGALAACFVAALFFTPLGGYARSFLTIFEPQRFEPIRVSRADLQDLHLLPQANDVGVQRVVRKPKRTYYASIDSALQHVPFHALRPTVLPPKFGTVHSFFVTSPGEMAFTFSAAKARAFEKRSNKTLPPMPRGLDGTTVRLQTGQVFNAHYEVAAKGHPKSARDSKFFELIEAAAPQVTSTGATLDTLERYLLSMPNVSPNLANQIRALGDIQNTVPVPVIIDKQTARPVTVNGSSALAIGDDTGLGAGVMWQKNGVIYVVAGPLSMNEVMAVADGLR